MFPVFMLVLSGILDFGFMLYSRMTVISATREGAHAVLSDATKNDPTTIRNIPDRVQSSASNAALGLAVTSTTTCVLPDNTTPCAFTGTSSTTPPIAASGDSVKVTVTHTYTSFFPLLFGLHFDLKATVQMVLE